MKRILLAGLLGGLALFLWEFVAHDVLPLGEAGLRSLDKVNSLAMQEAWRAAVKEPGFYMVPGPDTRPGMTAQEKQDDMAKFQESWRKGPSGIMVVHPEGSDKAIGLQLGTQFAGDVVVMLLAAFVVAQLRPAGFVYKVMMVAMLGLLPTLQSELPQWNWYGFPTQFMLAQLTTHLVGFCLGGLILAKLVRTEGGVRQLPHSGR